MRAKRDSKYKSTRVTRESNSKQPTRYFSSKQEKYVAEKFEGKRQPNSGATPFAKGDVLLDDILLECKTKTSHSQSISIKKEWIEKNKQEALFVGKPYSALAFNFGENEHMYYIIDEELFQILTERLNNDE